MNEVLYRIVETIRYIGILIQPFIPDSAAKILDQLSVPEDNRDFRHLTQEFAIKPSTRINEPLPIFPRLEIRN